MSGLSRLLLQTVPDPVVRHCSGWIVAQTETDSAAAFFADSVSKMAIHHGRRLKKPAYLEERLSPQCLGKQDR
jgi:hypothetical protein